MHGENGVFKTAVWKMRPNEICQNLIDSGVKGCSSGLLDEDAYPDSDGRLSSHRQFLENAAELGVESVVVINKIAFRQSGPERTKGFRKNCRS